MKFFEDHFNAHHFFKKPHKWFLAFLCAPIHFLELHYKKRYHLKFSHARKLFLFDITLILSILALIGATIFWFTYNPGISNLISLSIKPSTPKIISGQQITYTIFYQNNSDTTLLSPEINLVMPQGFIPNETSKFHMNDIDDAHRKFILKINNLKPGDNGSLEINGRFYAIPFKEILVSAILSYNQESQTSREEKKCSIITKLQGSVLDISFEAPNKSMAGSVLPFSLTLTNNSDIELSTTTVPFINIDGLLFNDLNSPFGNISPNNTWMLTTLKPGEKTTVSGNMRMQVQNKQDALTIPITPTIEIDGRLIPQQTLNHEISIVHPQTSLQASWIDSISSISPNETADLLVNISNNGDIALSNLSIHLPLPESVVDVQKAASLNQGLIANNKLIISNTDIPLLLPREEKTKVVHIPLKYIPQGGTDITMTLNPEIHAFVADLPNQTYTVNTKAPSLAVGTQLILNAEIRYYTNEGDQLGRGPLPPQVEKETKYFVMINIQNTTSEIKDLTLTTSLPAGVMWTGKTSVSHGQDVIFNSSNRTVSWYLAKFNSHTTAGIYFELAVTPEQSQVGTVPLLLNNITVSGFDTYIKKQITKYASSLDGSLPNDAQAKEKGVAIE